MCNVATTNFSVGHITLVSIMILFHFSDTTVITEIGTSFGKGKVISVKLLNPVTVKPEDRIEVVFDDDEHSIYINGELHEAIRPSD